ncbi:MAG: 1-deoxy-D-xylulose-5-phosphate reductoisomerase [Fimbriimonadaceae bacterium]
MAGPKRIVVLGSTGSIGTQTLDVLEEFADRFHVVGLAARSNAELLAIQAARFGMPRIWLFDVDGIDGLVEAATLPSADIVVVCVAGVIGLVPTIAAISAGKDIALASKEVLVAAGEVVMPLVREHGVHLRPIDSEHSALFQCLQGYATDQIDELIITASGGPFRGWSRDEMAGVSADQALNHPTWRMGGKITIDSATLMNKALEMIEAKWLFDVPMSRIRAVVHPQSIVHSMVKLTDGSVLGQMGWPNMRLPILYALSYPDRLRNSLKPWNPVDTPHLTFEAVDETAFPALKLARDAMKVGGTMPCAFNAANEVAANAFLAGDVGFLGITETVALTMDRHEPLQATLENLYQADAHARRVAREVITAVAR